MGSRNVNPPAERNVSSVIQGNVPGTAQFPLSSKWDTVGGQSSPGTQTTPVILSPPTPASTSPSTSAPTSASTPASTPASTSAPTSSSTQVNKPPPPTPIFITSPPPPALNLSVSVAAQPASQTPFVIKVSEEPRDLYRHAYSYTKSCLMTLHW